MNSAMRTFLVIHVSENVVQFRLLCGQYELIFFYSEGAICFSFANVKMSMIRLKCQNLTDLPLRPTLPV